MCCVRLLNFVLVHEASGVHEYVCIHARGCAAKFLEHVGVPTPCLDSFPRKRCVP